MIHINKTPFPEFTDFVRRNQPKNWDDLAEPCRNNTRKYILENEQENQCAYTELPLIHDKNNSHIEHLKRRDSSFFPELTFIWTNLFVSCNSSDFGGKYKDEKYLKGKAKSDNELIINPNLEDPGNFFELKSWGEFTIKSDLRDTAKRRAEETILAFNLNHNSLKEKRKEILRCVKAYKDGGIDFKMINEYLLGSGFKGIIHDELHNLFPNKVT